MSKLMILKPRMSEKAYALSQVNRTYVIDVPRDATKITVVKAVEMQFDVTVTNVRMVLGKGKVKRTVRKGGRAITGTRSDVKKAYITVKSGSVLPFFAEIEAAEAEAKAKAEKASKTDKSAKKAKKEEK